MNGKVNSSLIVSNDNGSPPPVIVVSNRLPFVLKRDADGGKLSRFHRYRLLIIITTIIAV